VARFWIGNLDYQSNTVIIAELVFRGPSQRDEKANATRSVALKSFGLAQC